MDAETIGFLKWVLVFVAGLGGAGGVHLAHRRQSRVAVDGPSTPGEAATPVSRAEYLACRKDTGSMLRVVQEDGKATREGLARVEGRMSGLEDTTGAIRDHLMKGG